MFLFQILTVCVCMTVIYSSRTTNIELTTTTDIKYGIYNLTQGKDKSLFNCPSISFEDGEYEIYPNGTLYIDVYDKTWNESHYLHVNATVYVCSFFDEYVVKEHDIKLIRLTQVGLFISMICLLVHLIVFILVPDLRNLPGWNLAALCMSLFLSYLIFFIISSDLLANNKNICVASASLVHFFLLASFLWMFIMSYDTFLSLQRTAFRSSHSNLKKFLINCSFAFGVAFVIAIIALLSDVLDIVPPDFKPLFEKRCWFSQKQPLLIFFTGPVLVLISLNFILFGLSICTIHFSNMEKDHDDWKCVWKKNCLIYFRLSVIMGITWVVGIVAIIAKVNWVWYIFVTLNTLQGLFIFLAFTCNKKVIRYFRVKLLSRQSSIENFSQNFNSSCMYSVEKELDNVVVKNKDKVDIVII